MSSGATPAWLNSSSEKNVIDSLASIRFCQSCSTVRAPGKRPAKPMTAMSRSPALFDSPFVMRSLPDLGRNEPRVGVLGDCGQLQTVRPQRARGADLGGRLLKIVVAPKIGNQAVLEPGELDPGNLD